MNILYIHGLGSDAESTTGKYLKELFKPVGEVITESFDLMNYEETIKKIRVLIRERNIKLLIGTSFGGFYTLSTNIPSSNFYRIVFNPCMFPSIEIPKLTNVDENFVSNFQEYEQQYLKEYTEPERVFGVFGKDDELFHYKSQFESLNYSSSNSILIEGRHKFTEDQIKEGIAQALKYFNSQQNLRESMLKPKRMRESFVNILTKRPEDQQKLNKYKDQVYQMIQDGYANIGGPEGLNSVEDLVADSDFWKLDVYNGKIRSLVVYTFKRGGRKVQYLTASPDEEGKASLYRTIKDDCRLQDREAWVEASGKIEHIYKKYGNAEPAMVQEVQKLLYDKKLLPNPPELGDMFHYSRKIGDNDHVKATYGNLPKYYIKKIDDEKVEVWERETNSKKFTFEGADCQQQALEAINKLKR